jgi:hypothetical protein
MSESSIVTEAGAGTSALSPHAATEARLHARSHVTRRESVALGQDASKAFENEHE